MTRNAVIWVAVAILVGALPAMAADESRNTALPTGKDANWSDPNWVLTGTTTLVGYPYQPGDVARIGSADTAAVRTIWLDSNVTLGKLYWNYPNTTATGLNLTAAYGDANYFLTFDNGLGFGKAMMANYSDATKRNIISVGVVLNSSLVVYRPTALRFTGPISGAGGLVFSVTGSAEGTLAATNTYSGTTTVVGAGAGGVNNSSSVYYMSPVNAGMLRIESMTAIPDKTVSLITAGLDFRADNEGNALWGTTVNVSGIGLSSIRVGWMDPNATILPGQSTIYDIHHIQNLSIASDVREFIFNPDGIGYAGAVYGGGGTGPARQTQLYVDGNTVLAGPTALYTTGGVGGAAIRLNNLSGNGSAWAVANTTPIELIGTGTLTGGLTVGYGTVRALSSYAVPVASTDIRRFGVLEANSAANAFLDANIIVNSGTLRMIESNDVGTGAASGVNFGGKVTVVSTDKFGCITFGPRFQDNTGMFAKIQTLTMAPNTWVNIYDTGRPSGNASALYLLVPGLTWFQAGNDTICQAGGYGGQAVWLTGPTQLDGNLILRGSSATVKVLGTGSSLNGSVQLFGNTIFESNQGLGNTSLVLAGGRTMIPRIIERVDGPAVANPTNILVAGSGAISVSKETDANALFRDYGNLTMLDNSILVTQRDGAASARTMRVKGAASFTGNVLIGGYNNGEFVLAGDIAGDTNSRLLISGRGRADNSYDTAIVSNVDANFCSKVWLGMSHDTGGFFAYSSGYSQLAVSYKGSMKSISSLDIAKGWGGGPAGNGAGGRLVFVNNSTDPNFTRYQVDYAALYGSTDANFTTADANFTGRFANNLAVNMRGGELYFARGSITGQAEGFGTLNLLSGPSLISSAGYNTDGISKFIFQNISRSTGATVFFTANWGANNNATTGLGSATQQVRFLDANVPSSGGILGGWATVCVGSSNLSTYAATDWACYDPNGLTTGSGGVFALAAASYVNTGETSWDANMNVRLDANQQLTDNRFVNSVKTTLATQNVLDLNGKVLNIQTGGFLASTAGITTIMDTAGGGKLTAGGLTGGELFITNNSQVMMRAVIGDANTDAKVALVKSGIGVLTLAVNNTYTGGTYINNGIVEANTVGRLGTGGIVLAGGQLTIDSNSYAGATGGGGVVNYNQGVEVRDNFGAIDFGNSGGVNATFTTLKLTDQSNLFFNCTNNLNNTLRFTGQTTLVGESAITVNQSGLSYVRLEGAVVGGGSLVKYGAGALVLAGAGSTFTGGWRVEAGSLDANQAGGLGTGNGYLAAGSVYARVPNVIGNNANVTVDQGAFLYLYGAQASGGTVTIRGTSASSGYATLTLLASTNTNHGFNVTIEPGTTAPLQAYFGGNNPYGTIRVGSVDGNVNVVHTIGNLTLLPDSIFAVHAPGTAVAAGGGMPLITCAGHSLAVSGTTTLVGGDAWLISNAYNTANVYFNGTVTGPGQITMIGGTGAYFLNSGSNDYSGGTRLNGTLNVVNRGDPNAMGSGAVTMLSGGYLKLLSDAGVSTGAPYRNNVIVDTGGVQSTIWVSPAAAHRIPVSALDPNTMNDPNNVGVTHTFQDLTIGNGSQLMVDGNSAYLHRLEFAGTTNLTGGMANIGVIINSRLTFSGQVTGSGRLNIISGTVYITNATGNNNYTGGTVIQPGALHVASANGLGTGPVLDQGALYLDVAGAANGNVLQFQGTAGMIYAVPNSITGSSSIEMNAAVLNTDTTMYYGPQYSTNLCTAQNFTGGVTMSNMSELQARNYNLDSNIAGNPLGAGQVTLNDSFLYLRTDANFAWSNDLAFNGNSVLQVNNLLGGTNRLQTLGALIISNRTLNPSNIVGLNGYQVAFSGLDLTGGLTISGLDLSFNRDPAKRVSILGATNLTVSADANLYIGGTADMLTDTVVDANFHLSIVNNNQVFVTGTAIHNAGNVSGPGLAASGRTNIAAGATLGVTRIRQQQVDVSGKLVLNGGSGPATSIVNALNIAGVTDAWTGLVDIRQGYLVLPSATASDVGNQVKQASNFAAFGSWDGTGGITSSSAAGDQLYGVGYADNAIAKKSEFGEANGLAYTGVLVRYTYVGDTNLDGITDLDKDYYNWSFGYLNAGNNTWYYGDFNYDGQVDLDKDYYIWSYGYLNQGSPLVGGAESAVDTSPSSAPVPEPATVGLLGLGLLGLLRRRSRKA